MAGTWPSCALVCSVLAGLCLCAGLCLLGPAGAAAVPTGSGPVLAACPLQIGVGLACSAGRATTLLLGSQTARLLILFASDEAHMFKDSWLPSEAQQLHFCRAYMAAMWDQLQQQQAAAAQQQAGEQAAGAAAAAAGDSTPPAKRQALDAAAAAAASGATCSLPATIFSAAADAPGSRSGGGDSGSSAAAVAAAAQLLLAKAQAHLPLVHLKWGLWGLIQDKMSDVEFDYLSYGQQRIERYHAAKRALLAAA